MDINSITEKLCQRIKKDRRIYKSYLQIIQNPHKYHPNSIKLLDKFGLENYKLVLIAEYPCQNKKQIERTPIKDYDATGKHHIEEIKENQNIQIKNIEQYK